MKTAAPGRAAASVGKQGKPASSAGVPRIQLPPLERHRPLPSDKRFIFLTIARARPTRRALLRLVERFTPSWGYPR